MGASAIDGELRTSRRKHPLCAVGVPISEAVLTLRNVDERLGLVPAGVVTQLGRIDAAQGKGELFTRQAPAVLERLVQVARIQSAESSNAIEGVVAPPPGSRS